MGQLRPCGSIPCKNFNFLAVMLALLTNYVLLVYEYFITESGFFNPWFFFITIFYLMVIWAYLAVVFVDPGRVPKYWGLMSQKFGGQRKYCLVCHNFKPDRSHHCSQCGRCVLNMDHHCPWINNCVGFQNRKYFLQFLIYLVITLTLSLALMLLFLITRLTNLGNGESGNMHTAIKSLLFIEFIFLQTTLFVFTRTHIRYVFVNTTTLEQLSMERKWRAGDNGYDWQIYENGEYNINSFYNFRQVFGVNEFYWFFPIEEEAFLLGRGLYWRKREPENSKEMDEGLSTSI